MTLSSGTRLGPYEIVAALGAGGMGEVYRAHDSRLGRDVALKVLPAEFARDAERLARFEREARTVAGLNHPNIVMLHSIEEDGGVRFITMELVEGHSLDHVMMPGGLPTPRVLELALALADALVAAHEKGVVHRDLKPANVMLTRDGRVKVLDFGLAKLTEPGVALDSTRALTMATPLSAIGQIVGTVPYMAPEQVRGESADARTDLFALGVLVYELACGRRPFTGATAADISSAILRDTPSPLSSLREGLPDDLERIVSRCLEKEPRSRFQTALDVHNELRRAKRAVEAGGTPATKHTNQETPSVAVLPFVNMSRDEENEYFSDGLAEELLNVLAKIRGLRVAARSSSFTFKGKGSTVAEIGKALSVASVLEGSVRKAGNRVRIAVQLVKVADGFHLWSETYDRTLDDIFAVQDDIAQSVVKELRTTLLGEAGDSNVSGEAKAEVAAAAKGRGTNPEAHRLFLQGRELAKRISRDDVAKGIECLQQATTVDPDNALAWAWLAFAYGVQSAVGFAPVGESIIRSRKAAARALGLEPGLAEAHFAMGAIEFWHDWDWDAAEASLRRAHELAPGQIEATLTLGFLAYSRGRMDEALELCRRGVELDPLAVPTHAYLARVCRVMGLHAEAEQEFRKTLELSPDVVSARALLSLVLDAQGKHAVALDEAAREKEEWARWFALSVLHEQAGRRGESEASLRPLIELHSIDSCYQLAMVYATRRDNDAAFEWLERGYIQRDAGIALVKMEPLLRPLHGDPRWGAFLKKMNLAD